MKYSYNWLRELSGTKLSPEKVRELLTMHSLEIEGMEEKNKIDDVRLFHGGDLRFVKQF